MSKQNLVARRVLRLPVACLLATSGGLATSATVDYEVPPRLRAPDVLTAGVLRSENHRVLDEIEYDGYLFQFGLETDYGTETVTSKALLRIRVREAAAVGQASRTIIERAGAPASKTSMQQNRSDFALSVPTESRSELGSDVDAAQFSFSSKKKARPHRPAQPESPRDSERVSKATNEAVLDAHRRAVAAKLQIDVYTSSRVAQQTLNALARSSAVGDVALDATFYVEREPERVLARGLVDAEVRRALKDNAPVELRELNYDALGTLSIPQEIRQRFLDQPVLSPRHKTFIVMYLKHMGAMEGSESMLLAALTAEQEWQAVFYEQLARALAVYNEKWGPIDKLSLVGSTVLAHTQSGVMVIVKPVDIVYWAKYFDSLIGAVDDRLGVPSMGGRELVVTGIVTSRARQELAKRGYTVRDQFLARR